MYKVLKVQSMVCPLRRCLRRAFQLRAVRKRLAKGLTKLTRLRAHHPNHVGPGDEASDTRASIGRAAEGLGFSPQAAQVRSMLARRAAKRKEKEREVAKGPRELSLVEL